MIRARNWAGLLISVLAVVWLAAAYDFKEMLPSLRAANYAYFLPVPVLLIADFSLRAARWRLLFEERGNVRLSSVFAALMIGYLFNNILPARGGEFIKIYLLGKAEAISKSRVLATVVAEKTADLLIAIALLASLLAYYPVPEWLGRAGLLVGGITGIALCVIVCFRLIGTASARAVFRMLKPLPPGIVQRLEAATEQFVAGLAGLFSPARVLRFLAFSASIWTLELTAMWAIAAALAIDAGLADLLFAMLMILFGTMVPSSPGYIGTYEFFGLNALAILGIGGGSALSYVIVLHGTTFVATSLIGIACLAVFKPARTLPGDCREEEDAAERPRSGLR
jgi:hypothetical protein